MNLQMAVRVMALADGNSLVVSVLLCRFTSTASYALIVGAHILMLVVRAAGALVMQHMLATGGPIRRIDRVYWVAFGCVGHVGALFRGDSYHVRHLVP